MRELLPFSARAAVGRCPYSAFIIAMRGTIGSLPLIATVPSMVSDPSRWAVSVSERDATQAVKVSASR